MDGIRDPRIHSGKIRSWPRIDGPSNHLPLAPHGLEPWSSELHTIALPFKELCEVPLGREQAFGEGSARRGLRD